MEKKTIFFDTECYPNYFLILFKSEEGKIKFFELDENKELDLKTIKTILESYKTVGFNSRGYDIPMILMSLRNADNSTLKKLSDTIIVDKETSNYNLFSKEKLWCPWEYDHIDIMNVAGTYNKNASDGDGFRIGLKMYGARIHTKNLQDLPYEPDTILTEEQKIEVRRYCINDVNLTEDLYNKIMPAIELRDYLGTKYNNLDFRSYGDAQIAEKILGGKKKNQDYDFYYLSPSFIKPKSKSLLDLVIKLETFNFKGNHGDKFDGFEKKEVDLQKENNTKFTVGVGGLHSTEKNIYYTTDDNKYYISYLDVTSYYPSLILNNEFYPTHLGKIFLTRYQNIFNERIEAKKTGDKQTSSTHKIILNGAFGKFNYKYSSLYDPEQFINITLTGQLSLLMLIEDLEMQGFDVISANTDGIFVNVRKQHEDIKHYHKILDKWQKLTKLTLEEQKYKAIYIDTVNHYIAFDENNNVITKGKYNSSNLSRNPVLAISKKAAINFLKDDISIEETITSSKNIRDFIIVRKATTGAYWKGEYLGKIVRWYWSTEGEPILTKKDDRVADSEGAIPCMNLDTELKNVDYQKYINKSYEMLKNLGVN